MPKVYWADSQGQLYKINEELSLAYFQAKERVSELSNGSERSWYARALMAVGGAMRTAGATVSKVSDHLLGTSILGSGTFISSIGTSFEDKKKQRVMDAHADVKEIEQRIQMSVSKIMPSTRIDVAVFEEVRLDDKILTIVQRAHADFVEIPHENHPRIITQTAIVETNVHNVRERAFATYHQAMRAGTTTVV